MAARPAPDTLLVERLRGAEIEVVGRMPWSSNGTFLVQVAETQDHHDEVQAVYKPHRGERPLWDFPSGLYRREAAAYELGAALGWWVVPVTVVRDGPIGEGSLQHFVNADFQQHYFTLQDVVEYHWDFQAICCLDIVANNTDRKSGHCLLGPDKRIWAIDNGLSFHEEFKLRTVIWEFGGQRLPEDLFVALEALDRDDLPLEEALKLFEEGIVRLREASAALADADGKVKTLIEQAQGVFEAKE